MHFLKKFTMTLKADASDYDYDVNAIKCAMIVLFDMNFTNVLLWYRMFFVVLKF